MKSLIDEPLLVFVLAFFVLWLSAHVGSSFVNRQRNMADVREDFGMILSATLILLGLLIGFSFSMAISRYDQRKNCEEAEANANWHGIRPGGSIAGRRRGESARAAQELP